jgi:hypothetical protein
MEIARQHWDAIECGCGRSARHLVEILESAIDGASGGVIRALDDHVFIQSNLMGPAPAVCAVAMAMLAEGIADDQAKDILWLILWIAAGEEDGDSVESSLYWRCFEMIRDGLWLIYKELLADHGSEARRYANDILEIVEWDAARLEYYRDPSNFTPK